MKRNSVPPSAGEAPTRETRKTGREAFLHAWIAFGMHLKNRADAHGVDWRGKLLETWMHEITDAEVWAMSQEEQCRTA